MSSRGCFAISIVGAAQIDGTSGSAVRVSTLGDRIAERSVGIPGRVTIRHPARKKGNGRRGRFERLSEAASNFTSSLMFYVVCLLLVAAFVGVHAAGLPLEWQHLAGDAMASVTLLLLALLKNAERRAEHAIQRKLRLNRRRGCNFSRTSPARRHEDISD